MINSRESEHCYTDLGEIIKRVMIIKWSNKSFITFNEHGVSIAFLEQLVAPSVHGHIKFHLSHKTGAVYYRFNTLA